MFLPSLLLPLIWQNFKTFTNTCLSIIFCSSPNITLILLCFRIQLPIVHKFNQNVVARCLPLNLKHAYQFGIICPSFLFVSRASPKQNVLQISIITLLYWSEDILNFIILMLIILMSMHFLCTQICNHYLPTCFLCVLLVGNMNSFWNLIMNMFLLM